MDDEVPNLIGHPRIFDSEPVNLAAETRNFINKAQSFKVHALSVEDEALNLTAGIQNLIGEVPSFNFLAPSLEK